MRVGDVLADGYGRVAEEVRRVLDGLDAEDLAWRPDGTGNSIGWLVWHLARVQDDHLAKAFGHQQLWLADGWQRRFGLALDPDDIGYGHSGDQVSAVRVESPDLLADYFGVVHERSVALLTELTDVGLDRVVDSSWDPPVTLGVRLISVLADDLQHIGQAAYVKGLLLAADD